jgi:NAD+ synthase (glutamine-hydrolysing)
MQAMKIVLAQLDFVVGDFEENARKILDALGKALSSKASLLAFPELALTGYPPEDLLLKPSFLQANFETLERVAKHVPETISVVVGHVGKSESGITNAASVLRGGKVEATYAKHLLPNYGVFDEKRYFVPGSDIVLARCGTTGVAFGISICEDGWSPEGPISRYRGTGASFVLNINGSPYHRGKGGQRLEVMRRRALEAGLPIIYVNLVGGQDELVFDGQSFALDSSGRLKARAPQFREALFEVEIEASGKIEGSVAPSLDEVGEVYEALVLGTRDYVSKNGFSRVVVGLSGGIDSSLTATIAVDALGPEAVVGITMPSRFTSEGTHTDAKEVASRLGIRLIEVPIEGPFRAYLDLLEPLFEGRPFDVTEENLQARIRGNVLMAFSNKFGWLVLATGNKSELATGYSTLYGDMAGGFSVLKDVPKTLVYRLAKYRNFFGTGPMPELEKRIEAISVADKDALERAFEEDSGPIPRSVIERPPSAELREGQKDQDTLPPYEVLDRIVELYVEKDMSIEEVIEAGIDEETARRVVRMIDRAEYKRRQAAPGVRITHKAFGKDRRLPITNRFFG